MRKRPGNLLLKGIIGLVLGLILLWFKGWDNIIGWGLLILSGLSIWVGMLEKPVQSEPDEPKSASSGESVGQDDQSTEKE